jgi:hypothetical protein
MNNELEKRNEFKTYNNLLTDFSLLPTQGCQAIGRSGHGTAPQLFLPEGPAKQGDRWD